MDPACILIIEIYDQCSSETDMISKPKKKINKIVSLVYFMEFYYNAYKKIVQNSCRIVFLFYFYSGENGYFQ